MPTTTTKRSVAIHRHRTSVSLEAPFWEALKLMAEQRQVPVSSLIASIDADRDVGNLSSAVRLFVLAEARAASIRHAA